MAYFAHRSHLPQSADVVFQWHMRPGAFERLIPPWVHVRILEREGGISDGGRILLGIRLGLRRGPGEVRWGVRHTAFEEGRLFQDEQVSGPLGKWVHTHRFIPADDGGCFLEDEVEWAPPMGAAGRMVAEPLIEKEMKRLFAFRHSRVRNDLALHERYSGPPLVVVVTGSSGTIGTALTHFLTSGGHRVDRLVRTGESASNHALAWDPEGDQLDPAPFANADGVVHLAGEPLSALRWTEDKKKEIVRSRTKGTRLLATTLAKMRRPPPVLVSASAVWFYGSRANEILTEASGAGKGFLARLCREWEEATAPARRSGIRVVNLRTGFLISPDAAGLSRMLPVFKAGLGGRVGTGRQYVSWIDLDDEVGLIHHALTRPGVAGPLNAAAPQPVPNSGFTDTLGRVLGRPTVIPLPSLALKGILGELGAELLLKGARVLPQKAEDTGYEFLYPSLEDSLRFQLGKEEGA